MSRQRRGQSSVIGYLVGRLGQLLRGTVLDTRDLDRQILEVEKKKGRMIDGIAEGLLDRTDPQVAAKLQEIQGELLKLNTQKREIEKLAGGQLNPDVIAVQLIERVKDLTGYLESQDVEEQRKALFGFCKRIVADAQAREIIIETDLTGTAHEKTPAGLPSGLCICCEISTPRPGLEPGT